METEIDMIKEEADFAKSQIVIPCETMQKGVQCCGEGEKLYSEIEIATIVKQAEEAIA